MADYNSILKKLYNDELDKMNASYKYQNPYDDGSVWSAPLNTYEENTFTPTEPLVDTFSGLGGGSTFNTGMNNALEQTGKANIKAIEDWNKSKVPVDELEGARNQMQYYTNQLGLAGQSPVSPDKKSDFKISPWNAVFAGATTMENAIAGALEGYSKYLNQNKEDATKYNKEKRGMIDLSFGTTNKTADDYADLMGYGKGTFTVKGLLGALGNMGKHSAKSVANTWKGVVSEKAANEKTTYSNLMEKVSVTDEQKRAHREIEMNLGAPVGSLLENLGYEKQKVEEMQRGFGNFVLDFTASLATGNIFDIDGAGKALKILNNADDIASARKLVEGGAKQAKKVMAEAMPFKQYAMIVAEEGAKATSKAYKSFINSGAENILEQTKRALKFSDDFRGLEIGSTLMTKKGALLLSPDQLLKIGQEGGIKKLALQTGLSVYSPLAFTTKTAGKGISDLVTKLTADTKIGEALENGRDVLEKAFVNEDVVNVRKAFRDGATGDELVTVMGKKTADNMAEHIKSYGLNSASTTAKRMREEMTPEEQVDLTHKKETPRTVDDWEPVPVKANNPEYMDKSRMALEDSLNRGKKKLEEIHDPVQRKALEGQIDAIQKELDILNKPSSKSTMNLAYRVKEYGGKVDSAKYFNEANTMTIDELETFLKKQGVSDARQQAVILKKASDDIYNDVKEVNPALADNLVGRTSVDITNEGDLNYAFDEIDKLMKDGNVDGAQKIVDDLSKKSAEFEVKHGTIDEVAMQENMDLQDRINNYKKRIEDYNKTHQNGNKIGKNIGAQTDVDMKEVDTKGNITFRKEIETKKQEYIGDPRIDIQGEESAKIAKRLNLEVDRLHRQEIAREIDKRMLNMSDEEKAIFAQDIKDGMNMGFSSAELLGIKGAKETVKELEGKYYTKDALNNLRRSEEVTVHVKNKKVTEAMKDIEREGVNRKVMSIERKTMEKNKTIAMGSKSRTDAQDRKWFKENIEGMIGKDADKYKHLDLKNMNYDEYIKNARQVTKKEILANGLHLTDEHIAKINTATFDELARYRHLYLGKKSFNNQVGKSFDTIPDLMQYKKYYGVDTDGRQLDEILVDVARKRIDGDETPYALKYDESKFRHVKLDNGKDYVPKKSRLESTGIESVDEVYNNMTKKQRENLASQMTYEDLDNARKSYEPMYDATQSMEKTLREIQDLADEYDIKDGEFTSRLRAEYLPEVNKTLKDFQDEYELTNKQIEEIRQAFLKGETEEVGKLTKKALIQKNLDTIDNLTDDEIDMLLMARANRNLTPTQDYSLINNKNLTPEQRKLMQEKLDAMGAKQWYDDTVLNEKVMGNVDEHITEANKQLERTPMPLEFAGTNYVEEGKVVKSRLSEVKEKIYTTIYSKDKGSILSKLRGTDSSVSVQTEDLREFFKEKWKYLKGEARANALEIADYGSRGELEYHIYRDTVSARVANGTWDAEKMKWIDDSYKKNLGHLAEDKPDLYAEFKRQGLLENPDDAMKLYLADLSKITDKKLHYNTYDFSDFSKFKGWRESELGKYVSELNRSHYPELYTKDLSTSYRMGWGLSEEIATIIDEKFAGRLAEEVPYLPGYMKRLGINTYGDLRDYYFQQFDGDVIKYKSYIIDAEGGIWVDDYKALKQVEIDNIRDSDPYAKILPENKVLNELTSDDVMDTDVMEDAMPRLEREFPEIITDTNKITQEQIDDIKVQRVVDEVAPIEDVVETIEETVSKTEPTLVKGNSKNINTLVFDINGRKILVDENTPIEKLNRIVTEQLGGKEYVYSDALDKIGSFDTKTKTIYAQIGDSIENVIRHEEGHFAQTFAKNGELVGKKSVENFLNKVVKSTHGWDAKKLQGLSDVLAMGGLKQKDITPLIDLVNGNISDINRLESDAILASVLFGAKKELREASEQLLGKQLTKNYINAFASLTDMEYESLKKLDVISASPEITHRIDMVRQMKQTLDDTKVQKVFDKISNLYNSVDWDGDDKAFVRMLGVMEQYKKIDPQTYHKYLDGIEKQIDSMAFERVTRNIDVTANMSAVEKKWFDRINESFMDMGIREGIVEEGQESLFSTYVFHMLNGDLHKDARVKTVIHELYGNNISDIFNPNSLRRKKLGTIKEINDNFKRVLREKGIDEVNLFEENIVDIYLKRAISHEMTMFNKKDLNYIVNNLSRQKVRNFTDKVNSWQTFEEAFGEALYGHQVLKPKDIDIAQEFKKFEQSDLSLQDWMAENSKRYGMESYNRKYIKNYNANKIAENTVADEFGVRQEVNVLGRNYSEYVEVDPKDLKKNIYELYEDELVQETYEQKLLSLEAMKARGLADDSITDNRKLAIKQGKTLKTYDNLQYDAYEKFINSPDGYEVFMDKRKAWAEYNKLKKVKGVSDEDLKNAYDKAQRLSNEQAAMLRRHRDTIQGTWATDDKILYAHNDVDINYQKAYGEMFDYEMDNGDYVKVVKKNKPDRQKIDFVHHGEELDDITYDMPDDFKVVDRNALETDIADFSKDDIYYMKRRTWEMYRENLTTQTEKSKNMFMDVWRYGNSLFKAQALMSGRFLTNTLYGNALESWMTSGVNITDPRMIKDFLDFKMGKKADVMGIPAKEFEVQLKLLGAFNTEAAELAKQDASIMKAFGKEVKKSSPLQKLNPFNIEKFIMFAGVRGAQENLEQMSRYINIVTHMKNGMDIAGAVRLTNDALFDYSDLTKFDGKVKDFIPFYSFLKNNVPLQFEKIMNSPATVKQYKQIYSGFNKTFANEKERELTPDYLEGALRIGKNKFLNLQDPLQDLEMFLNPRELIRTVSPLVKTPIEMLTNQQLYSGSKVSQYGDKKDYGKYAAESLSPMYSQISKMISSAKEGNYLPMLNFMGVPYKEFDLDKAEKQKFYEYVNKLENQWYKLVEENPGIKQQVANKKEQIAEQKELEKEQLKAMYGQSKQSPLVNLKIKKR